jgi:hypothetical protein
MINSLVNELEKYKFDEEEEEKFESHLNQFSSERGSFFPTQK